MERVLLHHLSGSRIGRCEIYAIARIQSLYFGRGSECDVRFDADLELMVSRSHAVIEWDQSEPRQFILTDLVSSNGTFVNGKRLNGVLNLVPGDQIQFGESGPIVRFEVERDDSLEARREVTQSLRKVDLGAQSATVKGPLPGSSAAGGRAKAK